MMTKGKGRMGFIVAFLIVVVALASVAVILYFPSSQPSVKPKTGLSFQACVNDANGLQLVCNNARRVPLSSIGGGIPASISINNAYGNFTYQGQVSSWAFSCTGAIVGLPNNPSMPVLASASGIGAPPLLWPVQMSPSSLTLAMFFGSNYGQKNITMTLGSKTSPCTLTVNFGNYQRPIVARYAYSLYAQWLVNYQAAPFVTVTSTSVSTSTVTTTSTSTLVSTTTSTNTVTTGSTKTWNTTISAASGGQTGTNNNFGIVVTAQQDSVTPGQTFFWTYLPPNYLENMNAVCLGSPDGSKGCFFLYVYQPGFSWTFGPVYIYDGWNQWVFPNGELTAPMLVGADGLVPHDLGTDRSVTLYNLVLTQTYGKQPSNLPPPPYDQQYSTWKNAQPSSCFTGTADGTAVYQAQYCTTASTTTTTTTTSTAISSTTVTSSCIGWRCAASVISVNF